jgi:hypothetical protein
LSLLSFIIFVIDSIIKQILICRTRNNTLGAMANRITPFVFAGSIFEIGIFTAFLLGQVRETNLI